ncbi:MAG: hypothetical protein ACFE0O_05485 [Opitutales bacterium]
MTDAQAVDLTTLIGRLPMDTGTVRALQRRPKAGVHEPCELLELCPERGVLSDRWQREPWLRLPDGKPDPRIQVALTCLPVLQAVIGPEANPLACGDSLFLDLDLTAANLPAGSRIQLGTTATIEISDVMNDGCGKFRQRFGARAFRRVRDPDIANLRLRGAFARIVTGGPVHTGDPVRVLSQATTGAC